MLDVKDGDARKLGMEQDKIQLALTSDRNFSIAFELGVRYPTLKAILNRQDLHIRTSVSPSVPGIYITYDSYMTTYDMIICGI